MINKNITEFLNDRQDGNSKVSWMLGVKSLSLIGSTVQSGKTDSGHFSCEEHLKSRLECELAQLLMSSQARVRSGKL